MFDSNMNHQNTHDSESVATGHTPKIQNFINSKNASVGKECDDVCMENYHSNEYLQCRESQAEMGSHT